MKIESLREVKANLSKIVKDLPAERSVVITKNGRPCAVLFPVTKDTDLESMLLAQRKDFWQLVDRGHKRGRKERLHQARKSTWLTIENCRGSLESVFVSALTWCSQQIVNSFYDGGACCEGWRANAKGLAGSTT